MSNVYLPQPIELYDGRHRNQYQFADRHDPDLDVLRGNDTLFVRAGKTIGDSVYHRAAARGQLIAKREARRAKDRAYAAPPPVPPEKTEAMAKLAEALLKEQELAAAAKEADDAHERAKQRAFDDPRAYLAALRQANTELHTVREWVARIKAKIAEFDHDPRVDDYRRLWRHNAAQAKEGIVKRRAELRERVRVFLLEAAEELIELNAAAEMLGWDQGPKPCDVSEMEEGYVDPGASDVDDEAVTVAEADEEEADDEAEHAPEDAEDEEELVSTALTSAPAEPESAATVEERRKKVLALRDAGKSGRSIAKELNLHQTTVVRILKAAEPPPQVIKATAPVDRFANSTIRHVRADGQPAAT